MTLLRCTNIISLCSSLHFSSPPSTHQYHSSSGCGDIFNARSLNSFMYIWILLLPSQLVHIPRYSAFHHIHNRPKPNINYLNQLPCSIFSNHSTHSSHIGMDLFRRCLEIWSLPNRRSLSIMNLTTFPEQHFYTSLAL